MTDHPTPEQLRRFLEGGPETAAAFLRAVMAGEDTEHLSETDAAAYVRGDLAPADREVADTHLDGCPPCAEDVADLRALMPARRRTLLPLAAAAAVAVIAAAAWMAMRPTPIANRPRPAGSRRYVSRENERSASLRENERSAGPRENDRSAGFQPAESARLHAMTRPAESAGHPEWRALVDAAAAAGRVAEPAVLAELRPPAGTLREAGAHPTAGGLSPAGAVVEEDRPRFTWKGVRGASSYRVIVFSSGAEVARGDRLSATTWQPAAPFPRGALYEWQVIAATPRGEIVLPPPAAPRALFRILSGAAAGEIGEAKRQRPNDHLLLGLLYAREGVVDRAEEELRGYPALQRSVAGWRASR
jgi:hypothetical protein